MSHVNVLLEMFDGQNQQFDSYGQARNSMILTEHIEIDTQPDSALDLVSPGFEGPEKLLEIWFKIPNGDEDSASLLSVERDQWVEMLDLVKCQIISEISTKTIRAYLLSESSLFVFPHKLILKTCGTTTLLLSLDKLFDIARSAGFSGDVEYFFYSRKSFMFPERQQFPHTHWNDEVDYLEKYFNGGAAYAVGKTNGPHWYCYLWENVIEVSDCTSSSGSENSLGLLKQNGGNDYTLEILMCDMDEEAAMMFTKEQGAGKNGQWIATSKLQSLYGRAHKNATGLKIDDFMFDPIGYSANGVTTAGHYFTVHVTPETICSYASFETNIPPSGVSYNDLVRNVVQIFKPKTFTVTLFAEKNKNENDDTFQDRLKACFCGDSVDGYKRTDRIHYEFEQYDLGYYDYTSI